MMLHLRYCQLPMNVGELLASAKDAGQRRVLQELVERK